MTTAPLKTPPADPHLLGVRLREERRRRGWTQERLAAAAGVAKVTIARIETQPGRAQWYTVCLLANALGVTPAELAS